VLCVVECVYIVCGLIVVMCFLCYLSCLIVVPLPSGENPFAVNNNNIKKNNNKSRVTD
jgi:hypothetical protein